MTLDNLAELLAPNYSDIYDAWAQRLLTNAECIDALYEAGESVDDAKRIVGEWLDGLEAEEVGDGYALASHGR